MDATQELLIGGQPRRQGLGSLQLGSHELVDLIVGRHVLPLEAGSVAHHSHDGGGVRSLKASKHRSFAATGGGHQSALVCGGNVGVASLDERLRGHVTLFTVGVGSNHTHLLLVPGFLHHRVFR